MELVAHPDFPPLAFAGVRVEAVLCHGISHLTYRIDGGAPLLAAPAAPVRADELWRHSCFELFVGHEGVPGYHEFNFAPTRAWAAYALSGYRKGRQDATLPAPVITPIPGGVSVAIDLSALPPPPWRVSVAAVVEEAGGHLSYWALGHPAGRPDFHDPRCFALEVTPGGQSVP
jgi:hypothetical protein